MVLADLGADVVKVERPEGGDETRSWGPPFAGGEAAYFLSVNRGKRSVRDRPAEPDGRELALELCAGAAVVIENFKVGGAERLGVGYERRARAATRGSSTARSPASARSASRRGRPGYDFVAQAESGLMSITGAEDGPPYKVGVALVDVLAGLHAAAGDPRRACTGARGARIEVPLLDSGSGRARERGAERPRHRREPGRYGNAHPNIVPYQAFETASGRLAVAAANDGLFRALCGAIGLDELAADERFATNAGRVEHRGELVPELERRFAGALGRGVGGGARRGRRPGGQGARRCPRRWPPPPRPGGPATVDVEHPTVGALELVASPIWRDGDGADAACRRRCWASTPPRCSGSSGARTKRSRPSPRTGRCCSCGQ